MAKRKKKRMSPLLAKLKAGGGGMAASTRGRARTFKNRKREAARKACRGNNEE